MDEEPDDSDILEMSEEEIEKEIAEIREKRGIVGGFGCGNDPPHCEYSGRKGDLLALRTVDRYIRRIGR